jgi:formate hydrogenlyase transcriptional activator
LLFRTIIYHPATPILITDSDRNYREASAGAGKLLGLPRAKIIGRQLDDFTPPAFRPKVSQLWQAFLERGEQVGTLRLVGSDGILREVEYTAKGNVLPVRHVLVLREKTDSAEIESEAPSWVQDYALYLLDAEGSLAAWYSGAARIYGYQAEEVIGQHASFLYPDVNLARFKLQEELNRIAAEGHMGTEGWQVKSDGSRFWANSITMALKDANGEMQGFARVVRDFTDRHEKDEKLRRSRARLRPISL